MILEALEFLRDQANAAVEPKPVHEDAAHKFFFVNGERHEIEKQPPPRSHNVQSLDEIVALAKRFSNGGEVGCVVWYSIGGAQLVIDDEEFRVDRATLNFVPTAQWQTVKALGPKLWFDQAAFVRFLRIDLKGLTEDGVLLDRVKSLTWKTGSTTTQAVGFGKASLGRSIEAEVKSTGDIPEEIGLVVRVHNNPGEDERFTVRCAVDINEDEQKLRLIPFPDEIARVERLVVASIAERLRAGLPETVPCYHGSN